MTTGRAPTTGRAAPTSSEGTPTMTTAYTMPTLDLGLPEPTVDPAARLATVTAALRQALYLIEHPDAVRPAEVRRLRALAGTDPHHGTDPWDLALEGTERAAAKWTAEEVAQVDAAIAACAATGETFTTDQVWARLGDDFLVTKGIAGRLVKAHNDGVIVPLGVVVLSQRTGAHGHRQRLNVWTAPPRPE